MDGDISVRILQLKNNFYRDQGSPEGDALGEYCVIGYFDAFDISKGEKGEVKELNTQSILRDMTLQLDGTVNCRMLVCITQQRKNDEEFWKDESGTLFFVTMVRVKSDTSAADMTTIIEKLWKPNGRIGYLSYDHSEIIVVSKTNRYSEGIQGVKELRSVCRAVKTYTVLAMKEAFLESYESIQGKLEDENVFCRLHCMVKDYGEAAQFQKLLEEQLSRRNGRQIQVRVFETFGGYDWLMEIDEVSVCSILECYKMKNLLTHANVAYNKAFFNIESEILVGLEGVYGG